MKYNSKQKKLIKKGVVSNTPKYLDWNTGDGKSLGALLYAELIVGVNKLILTPSQVLTMTWAKELEKWGYGYDYNISTTKLRRANNCATQLGKEMHQISVEQKKCSHKVRTIDYLCANILQLKRELPVIIFDEFDAYPKASKKLLEYIKKMYSKLKVAERLIFVSATGDDYKTPKFIKNVMGDIYVPEKNIFIKPFKGKVPEGTNFYFETYAHLEGSHPNILTINKLLKSLGLTEKVEIIKSLSNDSEYVDNVVGCIKKDFVQNKVLQNNFGQGVDMNMKSVYMDFKQMSYHNSLDESLKNFIQRLGRVNRTLESRKTPAEIYVNGYDALYECIDHLDKIKKEKKIKKENKTIRPIHYIISGEKIKIRAFAIDFNLITPKGVIKGTHYTYNENEYRKYLNDTNGGRNLHTLNVCSLVGISDHLEIKSFKLYNFGYARIKRKLERNRKYGI